MRAEPLPRDQAARGLPALSLVAQGVTVSYTSAGRQIVALRDAGLSLAPGELVGLVGPNGSGKTTFLRAATGIVRPQAGEVRVFGDPVASLRQAEIARRIAVVPQSPLVPEGFTVLEAVLMGRTPYLRLLQNEGQSDLEKARRALRLTDTWSLAGRPVGELSGGERQRVVLARALAQDTPILLLDEPTAHLDIGHQASVLGLVRSLCRAEGKAALAVGHDLTLAAQYCDRLVMLRAGAIVAEGSPAEVLRPDLLRQVYGASVEVFPHPGNGRPVVAPTASGG